MGMKLFTSSGTFKPSDYGITADMRVDIIVVGGGQGGTAAGSFTGTPSHHGGNAGCHTEYSDKLPDIDTTYAVTVGVGGAGTDGSADHDGTASSFGSLVTASGGSNTTYGALGGLSANEGTNQPGGGGAGGLSIGKPSFGPGTNGAYGSSSGVATSGNTAANGGTGGADASYGLAGYSLYGTQGGVGAMKGGNGDCGAVGGACNATYGFGGGGAGNGYGAGGGQGGGTSTGGKGADGCVAIFW